MKEKIQGLIGKIVDVIGSALDTLKNSASSPLKILGVLVVLDVILLSKLGITEAGSRAVSKTALDRAGERNGAYSSGCCVSGSEKVTWAA